MHSMRNVEGRFRRTKGLSVRGTVRTASSGVTASVSKHKFARNEHKAAATTVIICR